MVKPCSGQHCAGAGFPFFFNNYLDFRPQLSCISSYAFFDTVDFFLGLDAPVFFFALILLTREFLTPSLFFPVFFGALWADFGGDFFRGLPVDFFFVAIRFFGTGHKRRAVNKCSAIFIPVKRDV